MKPRGPTVNLPGRDGPEGASFLHPQGSYLKDPSHQPATNDGCTAFDLQNWVDVSYGTRMGRHIDVWGNQRGIQSSPHSWNSVSEPLRLHSDTWGFLASETIRCSAYLQRPQVSLDSIDLYHWGRQEKEHSNRIPEPDRWGSGGLLSLGFLKRDETES